jgi:hypothetical protein
LTLYLDASLLVSRFVLQPGTAAVDRLLESADDALAVSSFAAGELASALSRLVRMSELEPAQAREALDDFDSWVAGRAIEIETDDADVRLAATFVRRFELALRMPDALHLAACSRHGYSLVTLDARLARAAGELGLASIVPA